MKFQKENISISHEKGVTRRKKLGKIPQNRERDKITFFNTQFHSVHKLQTEY